MQTPSLMYSHAVAEPAPEYNMSVAFISRCYQVASSPFSLLGQSFSFQPTPVSLTLSVQVPSAPQQNVREVPFAITVALPENVLA